MANVKFIAVSRGLRGIVDYVTNREKTVEQLISGVNCVARTAVPEFEAVKKQFRKTEGRGYYHIVQAFAPDDPLDFATAHELGMKLAEHFEGYQCIVVTHMNTAHIHNHIIMNSVNFETGMKFHQSAREMQQVKDYSWTHVTGNTASKRAYITEGPLKGDVASYLDNDTLFACIGGVFALHGLKDTLISLGVTEVVEAMDMDQMSNPQVRRAILAIRQEVQSIRGIRYSKYVWNPAYKGIDDYYLSRIAAQ